MEDGRQFLYTDHFQVSEKLFLPHADIYGMIYNRLLMVVAGRPELKPYVPDLTKVDSFLLRDGEIFVFCVSPDCKANLPTWGLDTQSLPKLREAGTPIFLPPNNCIDVSSYYYVSTVFKAFGFSPGFAIAGRFPIEYDKALLEERSKRADEAVALIVAWAEQRRAAVENSRIFLSHKGVNKPLVEKVDRALRLLNLKTWFDRDDLSAGDPLLRGVDSAFAGCSAAVFFVSAEYVDAGVIAKEIDRALHEAAIRPEGFRIIPLVLAQHGGSDDRVPAPLRTLVWKTVDDVDLLPTILRALPQAIQGLVRYTPPR